LTSAIAAQTAPQAAIVQRPGSRSLAARKRSVSSSASRISSRLVACSGSLVKSSRNWKPSVPAMAPASMLPLRRQAARAEAATAATQAPIMNQRALAWSSGTCSRRLPQPMASK
jgi:hypothetical protein